VKTSFESKEVLAVKSLFDALQVSSSSWSWRALV